jgi:ABC transport system ATP-binding/permease protein
MDRLHREIARLEAALADAGYFARDAKGFDAAIARLSAARAELMQSEEQWLELEMKREELEGA